MKIPELYKEIKELEISLEKQRQEYAVMEAKRKELLDSMQNQCSHPEEMLEAIVVEENISYTCLFCKKENVEV